MQMPRKGSEKEVMKTEIAMGGGRIALRETWKECEKNGEQEQNIKGIGDG